MRSSGVAVFAMTMVAVFATTNNGFAQTDQLNAGAINAAAAGAAAGAAAAGGGGQGAGGGGGTTDGPGGVTGQGPGSSAAQDGGIAGGNTATTFVGQNQAGGFVGGGVGTLFNNNRQFRALVESQVESGGTRETSGTPRSIPRTLRIAFSYPPPSATNSLMPATGPAIQQVATLRPELRSVAVAVNQAGIAQLTGSVPDAAARRLAANLVRLRPGVRKVDNRILVAAQ